MDLSNIKKQYIEVKNNIRAVCKLSGRDENEITVIAVSKTFPASDIADLFETGHRHFGENRVQEMTGKYQELGDIDIDWHMIGHLQTNKVKYITKFVSMIHSVDSLKLASEIDKAANRDNRRIDILVQVNTSGEFQKSGVEPEYTEKLCREIIRFENIRLCGLMTIGKLTEDRDIIRKNFKLLAAIYKGLKSEYKDFKYLSMGMTSDYDIAIEEGANMLRIGSAIFGNRNYLVT